MRLSEMDLVRFVPVFLLLTYCSVFCFPSRPLNERSTELAWQAWLLVDDQNQNKQNNSEAVARRRITPKSIFIAPTFSPEALPDCADGYRADSMGRCIQIIKLDEDAHLDFLLQKLNEKFGGFEDYEDEGDEDAPTPGPFQVNIPLDEQGEVDPDIAIVVAPTNANFDSSKDSVKVKRTEGQKDKDAEASSTTTVDPTETTTDFTTESTDSTTYETTYETSTSPEESTEQQQALFFLAPSGDDPKKSTNGAESESDLNPSPPDTLSTRFADHSHDHQSHENDQVKILFAPMKPLGASQPDHLILHEEEADPKGANPKRDIPSGSQSFPENNSPGTKDSLKGNTASKRKPSPGASDDPSLEGPASADSSLEGPASSFPESSNLKPSQQEGSLPEMKPLPFEASPEVNPLLKVDALHQVSPANPPKHQEVGVKPAEPQKVPNDQPSQPHLTLDSIHFPSKPATTEEIQELFNDFIQRRGAETNERLIFKQDFQGNPQEANFNHRNRDKWYQVPQTKNSSPYNPIVLRFSGRPNAGRQVNEHLFHHRQNSEGIYRKVPDDLSYIFGLKQKPQS